MQITRALSGDVERIITQRFVVPGQRRTHALQRKFSTAVLSANMRWNTPERRQVGRLLRHVPPVLRKLTACPILTTTRVPTWMVPAQRAGYVSAFSRAGRKALDIAGTAAAQAVSSDLEQLLRQEVRRVVLQCSREACSEARKALLHLRWVRWRRLARATNLAATGPVAGACQ